MNMPTIITMCRPCAENKLAAGEKMKLYAHTKATTKPAARCQCCKTGTVGLKMYIIKK